MPLLLLRPGMVLIWQLLVLIAISLWLVSPLAALSPAVLVGPDLESENVTLTSLHNDIVSYFDAQRSLKRQSVDWFVQLRLASESADIDRPIALIQLTDGQRLAGRFVGPAGEGTALRWEHQELGTVDIDLEDVIALARTGMVRDWWSMSQPPASDTVRLTNGDQIDGYVARVSNDGLIINPVDHSGEVALPLDRIDIVRLANNPRPAPSNVQRLWLTDGTQLLTDAVEIESSAVRFNTELFGSPDSEVEMPLSKLRRIDFIASGLRLQELADIRMDVLWTDHTDAFALNLPPVVSADQIHLHAPIEVSFTVPIHTKRFAATAELAVQNIPVQFLDWADFELIITSGAGDEYRYRLHAGQKQVLINIPVRDGWLRVRLDPGVNGPILDRLLLRDAILLIDRSGEDAQEQVTN